MKKTLLSFIENIKSLACNQATIISPFMKIEAAIMKKSNAIKFQTLEFSLQGVLKQLKDPKQATSSATSKIAGSQIHSDTHVGNTSKFIDTSASECVDKFVDLNFTLFNTPPNIAKTSNPLSLIPLNKHEPIKITVQITREIHSLLKFFLADMKKYF